MKSLPIVLSPAGQARFLTMTVCSLVILLATAGKSIPQPVPSPPPSPFDLAKWTARVSDGVQYYECSPPKCAPLTLVSYFVLARMDGNRNAFDAEVNRWIGTPGDRDLLAEKKILVFSTTMTPDLLTLNAAWQALAPSQQARPFGAMRIGIKDGLKFQILATSAEQAAARQSELLMSRALGLTP